MEPKPASQQVHEIPLIRIAPSRGWVSLGLREFWEYRELLYFFAWRDIKVRYKQTLLGASWALLQPLLTVCVFSIFFGRLAKVPSDGVPYPVFNLAALVPWTFFAYGLAQSSNSLVGSQNLITKVYFPRLMIPMSSQLAGLVDFLISFLLLLGLMAYYHIAPSFQVVWLPSLVLLTIITSLSVGLWLSALNVEYRDIKYVVPFLTQFWMLATPIAYPSSLLDGHPLWKTVYSLNPMVGVVEGFRWALLGTHTQPGATILVSTTAALVLLVSSLCYFRRMEKTFADII